jgi:hypothetical protein
VGKVAILHFPHRAARCAIGDESVVTYIASDEVEAGPEGSAEENDQRRQAKQKREDRENGALLSFSRAQSALFRAACCEPNVFRQACG